MKGSCDKEILAMAIMTLIFFVFALFVITSLNSIFD